MNNEEDGWAGVGQAIYWDEGRRNGLWVGHLEDGSRRLGVRIDGKLVALFELEDDEILALTQILVNLLAPELDPRKVN